MSPIDERAEHWRQEQEIQATARDLERQARRDQASRRRRVNVRMDARVPTWQAWIIYPLGLYMVLECFRAVFLGGRLH